MPKLLFEDDQGNQHAIHIQNIPTKSLGKGDVLVAGYEIGYSDPPPSAADISRVLTQLKGLLESVIPPGVKVLSIAVRNGKEDISLKVLKNKTLEKEEPTSD
jgi:hypothetical protein